MNVFVLTGAGVSAESGLATFRDKGGTWTKVNPYELATPEAFAADPARVHAWYNERRRQLAHVEPNPAHHALARLAPALAAADGRLTLVTQNVDDLHERAGSSQVLHMHGELLSALCAGCGDRRRWEADLGVDDVCPACAAIGAMRPDIVWFGEMPYRLEEAIAAIEAADMFVAIGTSGSVYPASGFVEAAREAGAETLEINLEPSANAAAFDQRRIGPAGALVPLWVDDICAELA